MKKAFKIVTNNPLVKETLENEYHIEFVECSYEEILRKVRNYIYEGYELLTHPLSGSVKPNETPYKSIMVSEKKEKLDPRSMEIIEYAIQSCKKFQFKSDKYAPEVYEDFQVVRFSLVKNFSLNQISMHRKSMKIFKW